MECVSWEDAQEFLNKLNAGEKGSGWLYRLPTEAEWEYACRARPSPSGTLSLTPEECSFDFYFDQPTNTLTEQQANFNHHLERTSRVGSYPPNRLGIHDLHGNVWEWCDDPWEGGPDRAFRGGSWGSVDWRCRAMYRSKRGPAALHSYLGFRVARARVENE